MFLIKHHREVSVEAPDILYRGRPSRCAPDSSDSGEKEAIAHRNLSLAGILGTLVGGIIVSLIMYL
ncbi:hypothetical protein NC796_14630 [Aliifodinibius sp. S!AR15-10]|uniref:hypothetical protein n=1 Tax=Aliifodinibius sp. S!AR15-10 TaxID=2950437 RepID=UPI002857E5E7|nr:hypothetical protein [Aliifodinibius sp. S!AR15-10]MDR8392387.1 hypothetical protein [Aliifodinibius sp. S!AR15-10]